MLYDTQQAKRRRRLTYRPGATQTVSYNPVVSRGLPKLPSAGKIPAAFGMPEFIPPPDYGGGPTGPGSYNPPVVSVPGGGGGASGGGIKTPGTPGTGWDSWLASDPVYQQAKALYHSSVKQDAGSYLANVEQELLGYGSQEMARSVLGALAPQLQGLVGNIDPNSFINQLPSQHQIDWTADPNITAAQVEANPNILKDPANQRQYMNSLAQVIYGNVDANKALNESLNKANLWYSGAAGVARGKQGYINQSKLFNLEQAVRKALLGYAGTYGQQRQSLEMMLLDQLGASRDRYLSQVAQGVVAPPSYPPTPPIAGPGGVKVPPPANFYPPPGTIVPPPWVGPIPPSRKKPKSPWPP